MKVIKLENLMAFSSFSHQTYVKMPNRVRFKGMTRYLNENEVRQVCHLKGGIDLLSQMGVDLSDIKLEFDEIDLSSVFDD